MQKLNDAFVKLVSNSGLTMAQFARRSKVQQQNISTYKKQIGSRALLKACENYYGWPVIALREIERFTGAFSEIPESGGIYVFYDSAGNVVYLGKATNLRREVRQTYNRTSRFMSESVLI